MRRLLALALVLAMGAWTAIAERAEASWCDAPYGCISTFNACKLPCNFIKHSNNGVHH